MTAPLWLDHAILTYGYWAVLVAVALESLGVPFPGETALLAAAIYAGTGRPLDIALVIVFAAAGAIIGDNIGYAIGWYGGNPLVRRLFHVLHIPESALNYSRHFFVKHGNKTVFLGRFVSLLRATVAFLAGVNHMPRRIFFLWNAVGGIVWATLFGLLGFFLGRNLPLLSRVVNLLGIGGVVVVGALVVGLLGLWYVRRRQRRAATLASDAQAEEQPPAPVPDERR